MVRNKIYFLLKGKGTLKLTSYEIKFHGKSYSRANKRVFQRIQKNKKSGKKISSILTKECNTLFKSNRMNTCWNLNKRTSLEECKYKPYNCIGFIKLYINPIQLICISLNRTFRGKNILLIFFKNVFAGIM